ncbi:MAG: SDR family oxidoreductase [Candidatus Staskawiczbacteria bacterium]|nr:SDR family oxidoreductase [Candidatus Staskawiczbacteria bacterium]
MGDIFSLKDRKIIIMGGSGFFGSTFTNALLDSGCVVIVIDKLSEHSDFVISLKQKYSDRLDWYSVDLYDESEVKKIHEHIKNKYDSFNGLVNNAFDFSKKTGFNDPSGRLENITYDKLKASFDSGVYWSIRATKDFGHNMEDGSIVNICSMYSTIVPAPHLYEGTDKFNPPGYSMAKGALLQFTRYSASFLGPKVRVNAISPGAFPNLKKDTYNSIDEKDPVLQKLFTKTILKKLGQPNDLVGSLIFLLSDSSSYITGQNIQVDGGITVTI